MIQTPTVGPDKCGSCMGSMWGKRAAMGFLGLQARSFPKRLTEIRETVCLACTGEHVLNAPQVRQYKASMPMVVAIQE